MTRRTRWLVGVLSAVAAAVGLGYGVTGWGPAPSRGGAVAETSGASIQPPGAPALAASGSSRAVADGGTLDPTDGRPQAAPAADPGDAPLRVQIVGRDGTGLTSARLVIVSEGGTTRTRAAGPDGVVTWPAEDLPNDSTGVFAACDGFVTSRPEDLRSIRNARWLFALEPGVRVSGRVVASGTGAPIIGATVHVADDAELEPGDAREYGDGVTDAGGTWPPMDLPPGRFVRIRVAAEGFGVRMLRPRVAAPMALDVALDPEGVVTGTVVDEQGRPRPGVSVIAVSDDDRDEDLADGTSSVAGEFELRGLPRGVSLRVMDTPYRTVKLPDTDTGVVRLPVASSQRIVLTDDAPRAVAHLVVTTPASLRVTVLGPDGALASGGIVALGRAYWAPDGALVDGVVEFPRVGAGKFDLRVKIEGFESVSEAIETVWGQRCERTIHVRAPSYVAGIVEDEQGRPLAGAAVSASSATDWDRVRSVTGADGRFRLDGVDAAAPNLHVECPGRYAEELPPLDAPVEGLRIVARPLVVVRGRVVPPPGRTLGRFTATAVARGRLSIEAVSPSSEVQWQVPPGTWTFTISNVRGCLDLSRDVTVVAGPPVDLGDLRLVEGAIVEGVVVDSTGAPVRGADAFVGDASATSDASGEFRIEGVDPRQTRLLLHAEGYAWVDEPLGPAGSQTALRVVLERPGRLRAFLRLKDERSWRGEWSWRARREGSDEGTDFGNDDRIRRAVVSELRPGAYRFELWFERDGAYSSTPPVLSIPFRIEEGKDTELEVVIPAK